MSELNGYTVPDSVAGKKTPTAAEIRQALIDAVGAALPILRSDRDGFVRSNALRDDDGSYSLSTLDEDDRDVVDEYDNAIALCEDALQKAGLR